MYKVMNRSSWSRLYAYVVTDQPAGWKDPDREWPWVAEFKVSMRHDEETQKRRAYEYADYLNKGIVVQPPIGA